MAGEAEKDVRSRGSRVRDVSSRVAIYNASDERNCFEYAKSKRDDGKASCLWPKDTAYALDQLVCYSPPPALIVHAYPLRPARTFPRCSS